MEFLIQTLWILIVSTMYINCAKLPQNRENSHVLSNSLNPISERTTPVKPREWLKITQAPPKVINTALGTRIELECEAIGSPSPRIQWIKDGVSITEDYDYENSVTSDTAIAKIISRLIINSALPLHEGTLTCIAAGGTLKQFASSRLYVMSQGNQQNLTDFLNAELIPTTRALSRIVLFNTVILETIGSNIILPCKVAGKPKPEVFWFDNNGDLISNQNPRIKVLSDGELSVTNLRWSDMGSYTCVANNGISKDSISTFVYPMLNEN